MTASLRFPPLHYSHAIVRFNITGIAKFAKEMADKGLGKPKVSLQFELDSSGLCNLVKAEATVDETVVIKEEVEVDEEVANETATKDSEKTEENTSKAGEEATVESDTPKEDDKNATDAKKPEKKKKKTKIVEKVGRFCTFHEEYRKKEWFF